MEYPVIVEQKNGIWRAVIPALADLSAEGASRDEANRLVHHRSLSQSLRQARRGVEVALE